MGKRGVIAPTGVIDASRPFSGSLSDRAFFASHVCVILRRATLNRAGGLTRRQRKDKPVKTPRGNREAKRGRFDCIADYGRCYNNEFGLFFRTLSKMVPTHGHTITQQ